MAIVKPFKALRPAVQYAKDVAALPYDVYDREEAKAYVKDKPLSFLNIDRPETQFDDDHDMYGDDVYDKAGAALHYLLFVETSAGLDQNPAAVL